MEQRMDYLLINDDSLLESPPEESSLYLQLEDGLFCLAPWKAGLGCSRFGEQGWQAVPDPPCWCIVEQATGARHSSRVAEFLAPIPSQLRSLAGRYAWMQLPALRLLRLSPYAAQLASSAPFLFWLVAVAFQEQRLTAGECLGLFGLPRKKILAAVMGEDPGKKYLALATLGKLHLRRYGSDEYAMFMALYHSGLFEVARHAPYIYLDHMLDIFIEPRLLHAEAGLLAKLPFFSWPQARWLYTECLRLAMTNEYAQRIAQGGKGCTAELTSFDLVRQRCLACRSLHELRRLHDALADAVCAIDCAVESQSLFPPAPFPPVPFPGSDTIEPIASAKELREEGIAMKHCVYSLLQGIHRGRYYVYRVLAPQRGTLCITGLHLQPRIWEFALYRNASPAPHAWEHVHQWLKRAVEEKAAMLAHADRDDGSAG